MNDPVSAPVPITTAAVPIHRDNADDPDTQRRAFWHLQSIVRKSVKFYNLDEALFPRLTRQDIEAIAIMIHVWRQQDNMLAEFESFCERFNFEHKGEKHNLLDLFQEEQNER